MIFPCFLAATGLTNRLACLLHQEQFNELRALFCARLGPAAGAAAAGVAVVVVPSIVA